MDIAKLLDAMARLTSVLLAQLATQGGGVRLANTANQVAVYNRDVVAPAQTDRAVAYWGTY